jgi:hypothetical protein
MLAVILAAAVSAAPAPAPKPGAEACADPKAALPGLVARALEHGEDKSSGPPQTKVLGRETPLKRLVFDGEPSYVLDVTVRPEPDGESSATGLLLTRVDHGGGALHRELYAATLQGELRSGAVFSDRLGEDGKPTGAPTLHQPLRGRDRAARAAFASALKELCLQGRGLSAQERLEGLPEPGSPP